MKPSHFLLLVLPLLLTACGLSPQQKADYATVEHRGISPAIYDKMVHHDPLGVCDIEALAAAHVDSGIVLRYLRDHDFVYYLTASDVRGMKQAGVSPRVIDYMLFSSRGAWWSPGPYPLFGAGRYTFGPGFYGGYFSGFSYGGYGWGHHP